MVWPNPNPNPNPNWILRGASTVDDGGVCAPFDVSRGPVTWVERFNWTAGAQVSPSKQDWNLDILIS